MTEDDAITAVERALDRWNRACKICSGPTVMQADREDKAARMMDLDAALIVLDRFRSERAQELSQKAHRAFMGAAA